MKHMIVEIATHGSVIRRDHESFVIQIGDIKEEVPAEKVESIAVTSNSMISTKAIELCLERNIQLVLLDGIGRPIGRFWASSPGKNTEIRRRQYASQEGPQAFEISKDITLQKIKGQRRFLIDLKNNRSDESINLRNAISLIHHQMAILSELTYSANWKSQMLGIEGYSASLYFRTISSILPKRWSFTERSQYPARDGFNALLNYLYGMGYISVEKSVILSGLDPNAGFYHADAYGRSTLVYDIIEIFRPLIDRIAVSFFTKKKVNENWFETLADEGIRISKSARYKLIAEYDEKARKKIEKGTWEQCRRLISLTSGEGEL